MAPGSRDVDPPAAGSPTIRPTASRRSRSRPELETLTFHPRPDADGLVARLGTGTLVPPHPADADRVTPGEAWACTLATGPGGGTVARLVARVEPAGDGTPTDERDPDASPASAGPDDPGAGGEAPSHPPTSPSPTKSPGTGGAPRLGPEQRERLERRRRELIQREEMLEAQLEEVRQRILDVDEMLGT